jgi:(2S)-methylsuccinyl-CoA dehydrogenase
VGGLDEAQAALDAVADRLAARASDETGRLKHLDAVGPDAFAWARHTAQVAAAEAMQAWGANHGAFEAKLAETYVALACADLAGWLARSGETLSGESKHEALATERLAALGAEVCARKGSGAHGLSEENQALRDAVARFADAELAPLAESIHRGDRLVPEAVLAGLADLGVFGVSIPEAYGGCFSDHGAMIAATEALSAVSLGAGGSVITRPEICAKALLAGGSEEQKRRFLPAIAAGERMVCVAVTEADAGSDVAALRLRATPTDGGYLLTGEKTWCTFAGRADLLVVLARTGDGRNGEPSHRGLSLFLVDKPATVAGEGDEYAFAHSDDRGGALNGRAIPTVGYRGMHSFVVSFEGWFVPTDQRIGSEGDGFYLCMKGFAGGRIQTAARAVGVMEAALRSAIRYAGERRVFGGLLADLPLTRCKLAEMAARVQAGRQLALATGALIDSRGEAAQEASLVKLLTCRDAEWVTREAMQLHGGMGYSEEFPISRLWLDARVLSIFEGAEEVLALRVIARSAFRERLATV